MRKKLLAGVMALALCSTNMLPQTILAGEFTSGNLEEVSEETPEIFSDDNQEVIEETEEELSVFSSESIPEFSNEANIMPATADGTDHINEINMDEINNKPYNKNNGKWEITSVGSYRFNGKSPNDAPIIIDNIDSGTVKVYLNNVNIETASGPALQITSDVQAQVCIYLENENKLISKHRDSAALQKDNNANLTIDNATNTTPGTLTVQTYFTDYSKSGFGAGIGSGFGDGSSGSCSNITINGGSVKASSVSGSPTNAQEKVYCCTIENPENANVTIKTETGSSVWNWKPVNHSSLDPDDTNLYVWLPKLESNSTNSYLIILDPENSSESRTRNYSFDTVTNTFKAAQVVNDFIFKSPVNLIYDGQPKEASLEFKFKPTHENNRKISLVYYKGNYNDINENTQPLQGVPVNAGTYTVKAEIEASKSYFAHKGLVSPKWTFTIEKAPVAPGADPNETTISVPWSCKKISDITNPFSTDWNWDNDVKLDQELQVGTPITATAIYNGDDKGNYEKESITYTITRSQCTHEHTAGRYYSSPSCTSSGYSGDTYCTDCNETLSYGYIISAYGHDYDNGVITTEPTTETDGIITYTCKRCKHQDTKNLGKLGDGEPYIEGSFQKKGWDAVNDLIKASKEKDTISIILNGAKILPASVLSGIKGKDISLNLDMENGFIWKINGTSITSETPADIDLSVTNTAEYIPAALYSLISTNQNDFGFHLGRSGAFDFPAVLSVKADASCAGLMANLFWYDVENGVLQCIQTVTVGGAFERSIPYADFTLSKGQDYFIAFGTESLNGRVIHTDGSITDENGAYLRPANTKISSHSIDRNKLTVKLSKGCAGAQGYDFVISKKSNMLQTGKFSKTVSSTGKPQASFRYLAKGTWYVAARSWVLDAQGNKVYGSWTKIKKIKITVVTPQQPKIKNITVEGNTVTITYTKCKNATGYKILLGNKYKTSAGEKYPVKKYLKRTEGKNTVTVTFTNVKKGTWYVTVRSWNKTSKDKSRVYSPYSDIKKFKVKK